MRMRDVFVVAMLFMVPIEVRDSREPLRVRRVFFVDGDSDTLAMGTKTPYLGLHSKYLQEKERLYSDKGRPLSHQLPPTLCHRRRHRFCHWPHPARRHTSFPAQTVSRPDSATGLADCQSPRRQSHDRQQLNHFL